MDWIIRGARTIFWSGRITTSIPSRIPLIGSVSVIRYVNWSAAGVPPGLAASVGREEVRPGPRSRGRNQKHRHLLKRPAALQRVGQHLGVREFQGASTGQPACQPRYSNPTPGQKVRGEQGGPVPLQCGAGGEN